MSSTFLFVHDTRPVQETLPGRRCAILLSAALWIGAAGCASQAPQDARPRSNDLGAQTSASAIGPTAAPTAPPVPSAELPVAATSASAPTPQGLPAVPGFVPIPEAHKGKFPGMRPPKARMFALKPSAEAGGDTCAAVVGEDGNLCARVVEPGAEINAVHIERVTDLLSDGRAFNATPAKCFEPSHALVFYNDKGVPIGWSQVSLSCGSLTARPTLTGIAKKDDRYSVAGAALSYLRGLCKTLKMGGCEPSLNDRK